MGFYLGSGDRRWRDSAVATLILAAVAPFGFACSEFDALSRSDARDPAPARVERPVDLDAVATVEVAGTEASARSSRRAAVPGRQPGSRAPVSLDGREDAQPPRGLRKARAASDADIAAPGASRAVSADSDAYVAVDPDSEAQAREEVARESSRNPAGLSADPSGQLALDSDAYALTRDIRAETEKSEETE